MKVPKRVELNNISSVWLYVSSRFWMSSESQTEPEVGEVAWVEQSRALWLAQEHGHDFQIYQVADTLRLAVACVLLACENREALSTGEIRHMIKTLEAREKYLSIINMNKNILYIYIHMNMHARTQDCMQYSIQSRAGRTQRANARTSRSLPKAPETL